MKVAGLQYIQQLDEKIFGFLRQLTPLQFILWHWEEVFKEIGDIAALLG